MNCGKVAAPALVATNIGAALLHVTSCVAKLECRNELVPIFHGKKMLALGLCPKLNVTNLSLLFMAKMLALGPCPKLNVNNLRLLFIAKKG